VLKLRNIVVIPTYNEANNIEELVQRIIGLKLGMIVLIVDDNSPDGTGEIAEKLAKKYLKKVYVSHRKGKLGLGSAYIHGFKYALSNLKPDLIFSMDADFSHDPKYLPAFLEKINHGHDVVVGSRYVKGGGVADQFVGGDITLINSNVQTLNAEGGTSCCDGDILKWCSGSEIAFGRSPAPAPSSRRRRRGRVDGTQWPSPG